MLRSLRRKRSAWPLLNVDDVPKANAVIPGEKAARYALWEQVGYNRNEVDRVSYDRQ